MIHKQTDSEEEVEHETLPLDLPPGPGTEADDQSGLSRRLVEDITFCECVDVRTTPQQPAVNMSSSTDDAFNVHKGSSRQR